MTAAHANPRRYTVRPIEPADLAGLERFYRHLSDESRAARFHAAVRDIGPGLVDDFCHPDHAHREGVVAEVQGGGAEPAAIIGHLCLEPIAEGEMEMAIAVADAWQRRGVGRAMLGAAIDWAHNRGVTRLVARVRWGNAALMGLVWSMGLPLTVRDSPGDGIELRLEVGAAVRPAA
jgi:acetyltransferase